MFGVSKRVLALILAAMTLICSLSLLVSCDSQGGGDATDEGEATEAPVVLGDFEITEELRVVYPDRADAELKEICKTIAQAISETYGISVKMTSDWNAAKGPEIIVGKCTYRDSSVAFNDGIYAKGYGYSIISENEIVISARTNDYIRRAVNLFIDEVLKKNTEPKFAAGVVNLKNNEKPAAEYTLNGVKLEEYTIVADKVDSKAATYLAEVIKVNLYKDLPIVDTADFKGGHAIKIGNYGTNSYGGIRYKVGSETVDGVSTIYVDGQTTTLCEKGAEFLYTSYLETTFEKADLIVPEIRYCYNWPSSVGDQKNTGVYLNKVVETRELAEGVTYYRMKYLNNRGENVEAYAIVVEGSSKAKFAVWAGDMASITDGKSQMTLKTVGAQATDMEKVTGDDVIAAVNAGYFYIDTNDYPCGMRLIQGKELCPPKDDYIWPDNWIGITYEGQIVVGDKNTYASDWKGKLEYAVATGVHTMLNGKFNVSQGISGSTAKREDNGQINLHPLSAVSTTADGGFVLLCVDGRPWLRNGKSQGVTSVDTLGMMLDLEAFHPNIEFVNSFILDGGGSTEMVLERKQGSASFTTMNDPSDGKSRVVGDIIAIVIPKE